MALVLCMECEKSISDKAITCPGCGCPVESKVPKVDYSQFSVDYLWFKAYDIQYKGKKSDLPTAIEIYKYIIANYTGSKEYQHACTQLDIINTKSSIMQNTQANIDKATDKLPTFSSNPAISNHVEVIEEYKAVLAKSESDKTNSSLKTNLTRDYFMHILSKIRLVTNENLNNIKVGNKIKEANALNARQICKVPNNQILLALIDVSLSLFQATPHIICFTDQGFYYKYGNEKLAINYDEMKEYSFEAVGCAAVRIKKNNATHSDIVTEFVWYNISVSVALLLNYIKNYYNGVELKLLPNSIETTNINIPTNSCNNEMPEVPTHGGLVALAVIIGFGLLGGITLGTYLNMKAKIREGDYDAALKASSQTFWSAMIVIIGVPVLVFFFIFIMPQLL